MSAERPLSGPPDRAQAIQIGALFVFAFIIVAISAAQLYVVPDQNGQVEFNHNREAQDQLIDLRSNLLRTVATGQRRPATVDLGVAYPSRALLVNPAAPSGSLRTEPLGEYAIDDAVATDSEAADYWDGTERRFETERLVYQPSYNYYRQAPDTVLENAVLYNDYRSDNVTVEGTTLVAGRTINLVLLEGSLSTASTSTTTVEPVAVGGPAQSVQVESEAGSGGLTLTIPTELSQPTWESLLASELDEDQDEPDRYIRDLSCADGGPDSDAACGELTLTFDPGTNYDLVVGEAGVGSQIDRSHADPAYVVTTDGDGATVAEGSSRQLTVEVRDRHDNPVAGATVRFNVTDPRAGHLRNDTTDPTYANGSVTVTTGTAGRATVTYDAPFNVDRTVTPSVVANATTVVEPGTPPYPNLATFDIDVQDEDESRSNDDWPRPLVTAVEPDPSGGNENDVEFVELYVPPGVDATTYELSENTSGTPTTVRDLSNANGVTSSTSGVVYVTADESAFTSPKPSATVVEYRSGYGGLPDDAGRVDLTDTSRPRVIDQAAYGSATTTDGWGVALATDELIVRTSEDDAFVDTNASADWTATTENDYFGGGGNSGGSGPPAGRGPSLAPPGEVPVSPVPRR